MAKKIVMNKESFKPKFHRGFVRFEKLSDGWVRDNKTGLEWGPVCGNTLNPKKAVSMAKNAGGRLPTREELRGIGVFTIPITEAVCV